MIRKALLQIGASALIACVAWNAYLAISHLKQTQHIAAGTLESSTIQADISSILTDLTDMETGYKMFRIEVLKKIHLVENRFGFEPEVTAKISRIKGIPIYEVRFSYYGRTYSEGKKINWQDGCRAIYCIIKYNLF